MAPLALLLHSTISSVVTPFMTIITLYITGIFILSLNLPWNLPLGTYLTCLPLRWIIRLIWFTLELTPSISGRLPSVSWCITKFHWHDIGVGSAILGWYLRTEK
mgnify:FL=1